MWRKRVQTAKTKWRPGMLGGLAVLVVALVLGGGQPAARSRDLASSPPAVPLASRSAAQINARAVRLGALRISNQSDSPVRIALLPRNAVVRVSSDDLPSHWDFAPQEGSLRGLVVSLPDRTIRVKPGDVLVVFAQDGSRRYWGPYVIGETLLPTWSKKAGEWQLSIQP